MAARRLEPKWLRMIDGDVEDDGDDDDDDDDDDGGGDFRVLRRCLSKHKSEGNC